jgi:rhodanese-related sulfurtransferase
MTDLTPQQAADLLANDEIVLVDVREDYEWEAGRPAGAVHIPLDKLLTGAELPPRERPLAFMCLAGMRSAHAADALRAKGYETHNVAGGFHAWFEAGLPSEPDNAVLMPH